MTRNQRFRLPILALATAATAALLIGVAAQGGADDQSAAPPAATDGVVVFYFHGNVRCATCRAIESQTDEAIHAGFAKQLEDGTLTWRVVNLEQPANEHFAEDFQLTTKSVVLAEYRAGKVVRFATLDQVWQLVRSPDRFAAYVQDETRAFLAAG